MLQHEVAGGGLADGRHQCWPVHGALAEIGLPDDALVPALVAFNLGVEAGQLLVVAVTLAVIAAVSRLALSRLEPALRIASYGIGITGAYWLVDRLAG